MKIRNSPQINEIEILNDLLIEKGLISKEEIQAKKEIKLKAIQEKVKLKSKV